MSIGLKDNSLKYTYFARTKILIFFKYSSILLFTFSLTPSFYTMELDNSCSSARASSRGAGADGCRGKDKRKSRKGILLLSPVPVLYRMKNKEVKDDYEF